jgi:hypothetical protein
VKSEIKKRQKTQQKQDGCRNSPDFAESSRSSSTCGQGAATSAAAKVADIPARPASTAR